VRGAREIGALLGAARASGGGGARPGRIDGGGVTQMGQHQPTERAISFEPEHER